MTKKSSKCKNCKHEWDYSGESDYYATCPRCLYKVKVGNNEIKKDN